MTTITADRVTPTQHKWLRRAGMFGFWLFLIKGLLWLAAPFVFYFAI